MINYFNFKPFKDQVLITNDTGNFAFLSEDEFKCLLSDNINESDPKYQLLKDRFFIFDDHEEVFVEEIKNYVADNKQYLFHGTALHIFVVTNKCNANCIYCQAKDLHSSNRGIMSMETAQKAVDIALSSPESNLTFEFQGGEPLLNFDIIRFIIDYSKVMSGKKGKKIEYTVVSNLSVLNQEMLEFLIENNVNISTSLDGDECLHNCNRPYKGDVNSYRLTCDRIAQIKEAGENLGAIQTTTRFSLKNYRKIIDTYVDVGMDTIFIRPLTPLGIAQVNWRKIGYTPEEFIGFYRKCLKYLLQVNEKGIKLSEGHATIFLKKIFYNYSENYMELRSPCGASIGQMAYYYDGNIYTCDEGRMLAEMGNKSFKLGNVYKNTYDELMESSVCKAICSASLLEAIPSCCDCVYHPYCGTCPVINLAEGRDIFPKVPDNYKCKIYGGMLDALFEILQKDDSEEISILKSWL